MGHCSARRLTVELHPHPTANLSPATVARHMAALADTACEGLPCCEMWYCKYMWLMTWELWVSQVVWVWHILVFVMICSWSGCLLVSMCVMICSWSGCFLVSMRLCFPMLWSQSFCAESWVCAQKALVIVEFATVVCSRLHKKHPIQVFSQSDSHSHSASHIPPCQNQTSTIVSKPGSYQCLQVCTTQQWLNIISKWLSLS